MTVNPSLAAVTALSAWVGLALQYRDARAATGGCLAAVWVLLVYFTILTNGLVAVLFTVAAVGYAVPPWLMGGGMLSIALVAVIYALLLRDTPIGTLPTSALANSLVHRITPALVVLYWVTCVPKGSLAWHDTVLWAAYPLAYLGYVLVRGRFSGHYPYPFVHVGEIGLAATVRNATLITFGFAAASLLVIGIDHAAGAWWHS